MCVQTYTMHIPNTSVSYEHINTSNHTEKYIKIYIPYNGYTNTAFLFSLSELYAKSGMSVLVQHTCTKISQYNLERKKEQQNLSRAVEISAQRQKRNELKKRKQKKLKKEAKEIHKEETFA